MSKTKQLEAHYAVLQLDALRHRVVMSYRPSIEMLVAEFEEKHEGTPKHHPVRVGARERRGAGLLRLRAAVLELAAAAASLRSDCGTDPTDLPEPDDDVAAEYSRIRAAHETYRREQAAEAFDDDGDDDDVVDRHLEAARANDDAVDDIDDIVERHTEKLFDYANGEGPGTLFTTTREGVE